MSASAAAFFSAARGSGSSAVFAYKSIAAAPLESLSEVACLLEAYCLNARISMSRRAIAVFWSSGFRDSMLLLKILSFSFVSRENSPSLFSGSRSSSEVIGACLLKESFSTSFDALISYIAIEARALYFSVFSFSCFSASCPTTSPATASPCARPMFGCALELISPALTFPEIGGSVILAIMKSYLYRILPCRALGVILVIANPVHQRSKIRTLCGRCRHS